MLLFVVLLFSCKTAKIPDGYLPKAGEIQSSPYGSYARFVSSDTNSLEGELIAVHSDTIFVLRLTGELDFILMNNVKSAELHIYKSLAQTYFWLSFAFYVPSILGALTTGIPGFLIFGVPGLFIGTLFAIIEASSDNNMLLFPGKNDLKDFTSYARFPAGIPPTVDRNDLNPKIR